MNPPSAPFRSLPLPSAPFLEGPNTDPSAPFPSSPPLGGGRGSGRGLEAQGGDEEREKGPFRSLNPLSPKQVLPDEGFWPRVPPGEIADEWTVLRCASSETIELAEELRRNLLLGWSPLVRVQKRLPRRRKTELVIRSLLPSFVFVARPHADHAVDYGQRGIVPMCKRFLFNDDEVVVPGSQLGPLYTAQVRGMVRTTPLAKGDKVEILATPLYLKKGTVVGGPRRNDSYVVEIEGQRLTVIFPGFLLRKTAL